MIVTVLNQTLEQKQTQTQETEMQLVYYYVSNKGLSIDDSDYLRLYFSDFTPKQRVESSKINSLSDLVNALELIIPYEDKKINGAFFTPQYIVDFILEELHPESEARVLDPSCGCGAFLLGIARYYRNRFGKSVKEIINENIFGADILPYNIRRAKILLALFALENGEYLEESDFNLFEKDSLRDDWQENPSFDYIVGNPPYVKFQDLDESSRKDLPNNWQTVGGGTFNLYFAFFELGYRLLKVNGKLGYITPNNYFTSLSGEPLRRFFSEKKCVYRIVDFSHQKVFEAQTYTALTFVQKQMGDSILYDRIKTNQKPEIFLANANGSPNLWSYLNSKKWRLLQSEEQTNIRIIETVGTPLSQLFDICVGIATLKDELYFTDASQIHDGYFTKFVNGNLFLIEPEATQAVYKISDFRAQRDVQANTRRIICPYFCDGKTAVAIGEKEFQARFPQCFTYFEFIRAELERRDKGKKTLSPFYAWGRTQGIVKKGVKIITPTFSREPRFLFIDDPNAYFTNGYGLFFKPQNSTNGSLFESTPTSHLNNIAQVQNLNVLLKILNSSLMHYYVSCTSVSIEGGYPCYQKNFIEKFTIPELTENEVETLRSLTNKQEIDDFLMGKYHVNLPVPNLLE